jgi:hypothetical protein
MASSRDDEHANAEETVDEQRAIREYIEEFAKANRRADPKLGEDPGLLPLTEDPLERRLKRRTM